jgi:hypothetical protein
MMTSCPRPDRWSAIISASLAIPLPKESPNRVYVNIIATSATGSQLLDFLVHILRVILLDLTTLTILGEEYKLWSYFLSLKSKYSPQHLLLELLQSIFPCRVTAQVLHPHKTTGHACHPLSRWFLARLILRPWRWRRHVPQKRRLTFKGLHGVISQNIELFNRWKSIYIVVYSVMARCGYESFQGTCCLNLTSTLKMETAGSFKMLVPQSTRPQSETLPQWKLQISYKWWQI